MWSLPSSGAPAGSQRRARWTATAAPLQCRKGPVAEPGGRYGAPPRPTPREGRTNVVHKQLRMSTLQNDTF